MTGSTSEEADINRLQEREVLSRKKRQDFLQSVLAKVPEGDPMREALGNLALGSPVDTPVEMLLKKLENIYSPEPAKRQEAIGVLKAGIIAHFGVDTDNGKKLLAAVDAVASQASVIADKITPDVSAPASRPRPTT